MTSPFDRSKLSARESEILDFAIEGLTDHQIAQKLEISTSTVNSYWVRIRGKIGHLSRTELVGNALRQIGADREREHLEKVRDLERLTYFAADLDRLSMYRAALEALPEAVVIVEQSGKIIFANERFDWMLGYQRDELIGQDISICCRKRDREQMRLQIQEYLKNPHPMRLGIDQVVYGQKRDGSTVRLILLLDSRPTTEGFVTTCIVRAFMEEIDTLRRHTVAYGQTM